MSRRVCSQGENSTGWRRAGLPRGRKFALLLACLGSISLVLPQGQAAAGGWVPRGDPRAFTVYRMDGAPNEMGRWDPCRPIGYRVNRGRAAAGVIADVRVAVQRVSAATGLRFVYRGTTNIVPQARWTDHAYPADTQLIIAWIRPSQSTLWPRGTLASSGESLAAHSGSWYVDAKDRTGRRWGRYNRGFVLLSTGLTFPAGYSATAGRSGSRGRELMHELGHVVGLDHPRQADRQEVMYPVLTRMPAHWGRGDLAGLRIVGASGGCLRDVAW